MVHAERIFDPIKHLNQSPKIPSDVLYHNTTAGITTFGSKESGRKDQDLIWSIVICIAVICRDSWSEDGRVSRSIFFGPDSKYNQKILLASPRPEIVLAGRHAHLAELSVLKEAIEVVRRHFSDDDTGDSAELGMDGLVYNVVIVTDSEYLEQVFTEWVYTREKEYRNATVDMERYWI